MARITITELNKIREEIDRQSIIEYWADTIEEEQEARTELRKLYNKLNEARTEMTTVCYLIDADDAYDAMDYITEILPCFVHFGNGRYANMEECSITTYSEYLSIVEELLKDLV